MVGLISLWDDELKEYARPSIKRYKAAEVGDKVDVNPEQLFRVTAYACGVLKTVEKELIETRKTGQGDADGDKQLNEVVAELEGKRAEIEGKLREQGGSLYKGQLLRGQRSVVQCMIDLGISPDD